MKRHNWRKGGYPQLCKNCGILRERKTFKFLMAITNTPPYDHYKYETKMVYTYGPAGPIETPIRPECVGAK